MKKYITLLLIAFVLCFAGQAWATTYYVRSGGNDSSAGTSDATAWARCPGMSGWAGSTSLVSGDTVYFRSQDTWTSSSNPAVLNATAGVTYVGNVYGTGTRAKLQKTGAIQFIVQVIVSNVTVRGFELDGNSQLSGEGVGISYFNCSANISNITIDNCIIHNVGGADDYRYGIVISPQSSYTVSNVTISNCQIYTITHEGIVIYPSTSGSGVIYNTTITGCTIYNTGVYNSTFGIGIALKNNVQGTIIEKNYIYNNPRAGIQINTDNTSPTGTTVRYNKISGNMWGYYVWSCAGAHTFLGNLFINNGSGTIGGHVQVGDGTSVAGASYKWYNNTFYMTSNSATTKRSFENTGAGAYTSEFKNNIVYSNLAGVTPVRDVGSGTKLTHNNNLIFNGQGATSEHVNNGTSYNRTGVLTWESTAKNSIPLFTTPGTLFTLQSGSPAIAGGANLGATWDDALDPDSVWSGTPFQVSTLDQDDYGSWEIGAYVYDASAPVSNNYALSINDVSANEEAQTMTFTVTSTPVVSSTDTVTFTANTSNASTYYLESVTENGGAGTSMAFPSITVANGNLVVVAVTKWHGSTSDPFVLADLIKSSGTATLGTITLDVSREYNTTANYIAEAIYSVPVTGDGTLVMQIEGGQANTYWMGSVSELTGVDVTASRVDASVGADSGGTGGYGSCGGETLNDNFNDNDISDWTDSDGYPGNVVVSSGQVTVTVSGAAEGDGRIKTFSALTEYWASFSFTLSSTSTWVNTDYSHGGGVGSGTTARLFVGPRNATGTAKWDVRYATDAGTTTTNTEVVITPDTVYSIVMHYKAATAPGANNGVVQAWANGTEIINLSNVDSDTITANSILIGNKWGATTSGNLIMVIDDAKLGTTGAAPGGGTGAPTVDLVATMEGVTIGIVGTDCEAAGTVTHTIGANYTLIFEEEDSANYQTGSIGYRKINAPGTYAVNWTAPTVYPWSIVAANYKTATSFAVGGVDYTSIVNGSYSITSGNSTTSVTVQLIDDAIDESNETFVLTISNVGCSGSTCGTPSISDATGTGTINDVVDGAATYDYALSIADVSQAEETGTMTFTVTVSPVVATGDGVTFTVNTANVTATAGVDYTAISGGSGSITAGNTTTTVVVTILDDSSRESTETFTVTMSSPGCTGPTCGTPTLSDAAATGSITDVYDNTDPGGGTSVTACGTISTSGIYTLANNITNASGTCLTVSATGATVDLNGYLVTAATGASGVGIDVTGNNNIVKNGKIAVGGGSRVNVAGVKLTGSRNEIYYLDIETSGGTITGEQYVNSVHINNAPNKVHHIWGKVTGSTSSISYAPDNIWATHRNSGGLEIHDCVLVGGHRGINADLVGYNVSNPATSNIYNNYIQHTRTTGCKQPNGIGVTMGKNFNVYNNQIISDDGRGFITSSYGGGDPTGTSNIHFTNNRVDVGYMVAAGGGAYPENHVAGTYSRYSTFNSTVNDNIIIVDNYAGTPTECFFNGSDYNDLQGNNTYARNVCINKDSGSEVTAFRLACFDSLYITDNTYIAEDGLWEGNWDYYESQSPVVPPTLSGNSVISKTSYTPGIPTGLALRLFSTDCYLLTWNDNRTTYPAETQTYEYFVYKDNVKISTITSRGGTFFVENDVSGAHDYKVSAVNLYGTEGAACANVNTSAATAGWTGVASDTTPPILTSGQPTTSQICSANPLGVTMTILTNEAATCKFSTSDIAYASMSGTFDTTGGTSHSEILSLACSASYTYYVRCMDTAGNANLSSYSIAFTVGAPTGDTTPPTCTIALPAADPYTTSSQTVNVSGTASDDVAVSSVTWENNRGGSGTCTGTTSWSVTGITLLHGDNVITITALDAAGNSATDTVTVDMDTPPAIVITWPTAGTVYASSDYVISPYGYASDDGSVASVAYSNSLGGAAACTGTNSWICSDIKLFNGNNVITFTATDDDSNTSQITLTVSYAVSVYFISSEAGSDSNTGSSADNPWATIAKVNAATFAAGDQILFKRGNVFDDAMLTMPSSGSVGSPIIIGVYGSGSEPASFDCGGETNCIDADGQTYVTVSKDIQMYGSSGARITGHDATWTIGAGTYYVDATSGSDSYIGSESLAFQTLAKVAASPWIMPGDIIYLKRGETFTGPLTIPASGTASARISVKAYGNTTAARPVIQ